MISRIPVCPVCKGDIDVERDERYIDVDITIVVREEWVCMGGCGAFEKPDYIERGTPAPVGSGTSDLALPF